jgi:Skp family chaperone for outer membrane proteins
MPKRLIQTLALALPLAATFAWVVAEALARRGPLEPSPAMQSAAPTKMAVVDLMKVLKSTDDGAKWNVHINDLQRAIDEETQSRRDDLKRLEEEVKKETDTAKKDAMTDELLRKSLLSEEWLKLKRNELDRERSLHWQAIYRSLRAEAKAVATQNGIDLVVIDDAMDELSIDDRANQSRESQAFAQMLSIQVLFASDAIDITDQVITRMNNAASAAKPTSAP